MWNVFEVKLNKIFVVDQLRQKREKEIGSIEGDCTSV